MWPASFSLCIDKAGDIHRPGSSCTASRTEPRSEECLREFCATAYQVVKVTRLLDPAQLYKVTTGGEAPREKMSRGMLERRPEKARNKTPENIGV